VKSAFPLIPSSVFLFTLHMGQMGILAEVLKFANI